MTDYDTKIKGVMPMKFLKKVKLKLRKAKTKILTIAVTTITSITLFISVNVPIGHCATNTDISETLTTWMPIIVQFAMLGMIMGLLKKLGKW